MVFTSAIFIAFICLVLVLSTLFYLAYYCLNLLINIVYKGKNNSLKNSINLSILGNKNQAMDESRIHGNPEPSNTFEGRFLDESDSLSLDGSINVEIDEIEEKDRNKARKILYLIEKWLKINQIIHLKKRKKKIKNNHKLSIRILGLLSISLVFYSVLHPPYLLILLTTITVDWFLGRKIASGNALLGCKSPSTKPKLWLKVSIAYNLGTLIFFKYINLLAETGLKIIELLLWKILFYLKNFNVLSGDLFEEEIFLGGWVSKLQIPEILLPLGISFFTFQSMSYTIDVYRRVIPPERSWIRYGFYISFFPQLVAGPIVKAKDFLPQLSSSFAWERISLFSGFSWILMGAFKKAVLADRLAGISDSLYAFPDAYNSAFAWAGVVSYSFQIFLDFSGYSDIAIGLALVLGFRLPQNFRLPYLAYSFSDFWRRWHISLSSWLRDYLYLGLGGNRVSKWNTYRNLIIVMLLGGLWHGANWNFLIWGGFHGIFLAIERFFGFQKKMESASFLKKIPFRVMVFGIVTLLWIFFRSPNMDVSWKIFNKLFTVELGAGLGHSLKRDFFLVCTTLGIGHFLGKIGFHPSNWDDTVYRPILHSLGFAIGIILITLLAVPGKPFIYFVF